MTASLAMHCNAIAASNVTPLQNGPFVAAGGDGSARRGRSIIYDCLVRLCVFVIAAFDDENNKPILLLVRVECTLQNLCFEADDDDASYDFDLLFARRRRSAGSWSSLSWVLPASQRGFSACLWLRVSPTLTEASVISLSTSQRTLTSHEQWRRQDDRFDVTVTVGSHQVIIKPDIC